MTGSETRMAKLTQVLGELDSVMVQFASVVFILSVSGAIQIGKPILKIRV